MSRLLLALIYLMAGSLLTLGAVLLVNADFMLAILSIVGGVLLLELARS